MKTAVIEKYFKKLRFDKNHHLGLGDIRLTVAQQEMIIDYLKSLTPAKRITDMETGRIRKEIIGIYRHQPEGVDQIIDDIIDRELKKHAIEFKNWCEGDYAIKLGQLVPTTDDWTTDDWYAEFNQQTKPC